MQEQHQPSQPQVSKRVFDTYLSMVANSVGAKVWQTVWADIDGVKNDVTEEGILSCAFFVSSVLKNFDYIKSVHATVNSTVKDLSEFGWVSIEHPQAGAVVVYEPVTFDDGSHDEHIGICVSSTEVVSNSYIERAPVRHNLEMMFQGKPRKITHLLYKPGVENA